MADHNDLGKIGEELAVDYLKQNGYEILETNFTAHKAEIDIIARKNDWLIVVEVKTRSSQSAGHPSEAVTFAKQQQLTKLALAWLKSRGMLERRARFDVIAITWGDGADPVIEHYLNAFEPIGRGQMFS